MTTSQFPPPGSPPPPPRRLLRSRRDRVLGGVCGGAAAYLNMDATLVRVVTVLLSIFFPITILAYVVLLFALPEEPPAPPPPQVHPGQPDPFSQADPVWGSAGAPWEQHQTPPPAPHPEPQARPQAPAHPPRSESPEQS